MADTLRYLDSPNDPYWRQQEIGVEPPSPYTKYLVGVGVAALAVGLARTSVGQRGFRVLSRHLHGAGQTELERLVIGRFHRKEQLKQFLRAERAPLSARDHIIGVHMGRLDDWMIERQIKRARFDIGRLLGLRQLTVGDVLDNPNAFRFEAWYETRRKGGHSDPDRFMKSLRDLVARNAEARRMQVSPGLYVNRFGDVIDLRGPGEWLHRALSRIEEARFPIIGLQPLKIFRYSEIREARRQIPFHIYETGSFQPILKELGEDLTSRRLRRPVVWIGENLYDLLDPDRAPLATGVYGLSFGTIPRIMATMIGVDPEQIATTKAARRGWLGRVFDIGAQRQRSVWGQLRDFSGKKSDPYEPINLFRAAMQSAKEGKRQQARVQWKLLIDQFRDEAMPLDAASFSKILAEIRRTETGAQLLDELFPRGLSLDNERDLARALRRLAITSRQSGSKVFGQQLNDLYFRTYLKDPESFWRIRHYKARRPLVIGSYDLVSLSGEVTQQERVASLIQREILARAVERNVIDPDRFLAMQLDGGQSRRLRQLLALNEMERAMGTGNLRLDQLSQGALDLIEQEARSLYPWYTIKSVEFSPTRELLRMSGGPVLIHRAFRPPSPIEIIRSFNDAQRRKAAFKQTRDFLLQFTAGRDSLENFSTLTSFLYYMTNRLNEMAARYGLGLSPKNLGSAHQILSSLIFKRYMPVLLGIGIGGYALWEIENVTGIDLETEIANTIAGVGLMGASFFERTGITAAAKWAEDVLPGSELFWEMPVTSFFDARKTREEYEEFLREGRQPMRKGRWWQFSSTSYQGGRIQYFAPNWYQRMVSDYEWTPEGLGSKEEYYANAWFPTLRYPLAPLRYFVTDPYHWERTHYYTRPYPESGGFAIFEDIPIVGPALNQTAGRIFKPKRRMHEEELATYLARRTQEAQENGQGSSVIVAPVGPGAGGELGVAIAAYQNEAVRDQAVVQEQPVYTVEVTPAGMIRVYKGVSPATSIARAQNVAVRSGVKLRSQVRPYELVGLSQAEPEPPVEEIISTSDPVQAITMMQYQLSELGGLWGWMFRVGTPTGIAAERRRLQPRWQTPQMRATSIGRTFEDLNIGGFPGEFSELARRFIPNLPYYDEYREVNPIPNLMPSWLPGDDYFLNLRSGDPYIRIPLGEARLPGGGFARLNREDVLRSWANAPMDLKRATLRGEVSPYEFYDAFTRFKILADVAPYSAQYRYYADLLTKNKDLIPEGHYEEFQRSKREVSAVKERLRVFPYKFKDAQLIKEQVTIAKILDNNTFLTLEYPDNPIRLAGMYVPSAKNDRLAQEAGFFIYSHLMPGTEVTIGYTADPLKKFSDDTLNTIRAVVYVDGMNLNRELLELGYAREKEDNSPAGIHARYSPLEIKIGSLWESFAHLDTPIHTKFLQVRSPLEMYWREDLYGKRWRPWNLKEQIQPTLESWAAKPVWQAALYGAAYGALIFGGTRWRRGGIKGGALLGGALSFARWVYEQISGEVWVPSRRRLEWDIFEYMDYLTYVKYKSLYEATLREAEARGLEEVTWFFEQVERRRRRTRWERQRLMEEKRRLTLEDKEGNRERIREINARLRALADDTIAIEDPHPLLLQATAYRQMYESTLYGADPYGDMTAIMRALPPNMRDYFMHFAEASPEERELIRGRVPRGVERLLRARWGEKPGELPTPEEYFQEHYLPPAYWEGWLPGKDLRDIKVQIVRQSGIDPTELGVWESDIRAAEEHQAPLLPWNQPNNDIDLQEQLRLLLEGEGLQDVIVRVGRSTNPGITIGFDVEVDRQAEIDMAILHEIENVLR